mmetsp:Transcript_16998/g.55738  ORF Transcript_16998/g.55738 Transcript_16998/m.55738 type:complete len:323 (-) Transcript_16998:1315-2283(-)
MASTPPRIGAKGSSSGPCASIKRRSRAYDPSIDGQRGAASPRLLPARPPPSPWPVASDALRRAEPSDLRRASSACGLEDAIWAALPASWPIAAASLSLLPARIASLAALPAASAASGERPSSSAARVALPAATSARKPLCASSEPSGIETGGVPASAVDIPRMHTCAETPPAASSCTQSWPCSSKARPKNAIAAVHSHRASFTLSTIWKESVPSTTFGHVRRQKRANASTCAAPASSRSRIVRTPPVAPRKTASCTAGLIQSAFRDASDPAPKERRASASSCKKFSKAFLLPSFITSSSASDLPSGIRSGKLWRSTGMPSGP